jgi:hypothetical protein
MHAARHADAIERPLAAEAFFERAQHRHLAGCPVHPAVTALGLVDIFNVVIVHMGHSND